MIFSGFPVIPGFKFFQDFLTFSMGKNRNFGQILIKNNVFRFFPVQPGIFRAVPVFPGSTGEFPGGSG